MLTLEQEKRLIILLSLRDLGGRATKAQVLDNIYQKGYIKLSASDQTTMPSRNEEFWRNDLAFIRHHLNSEGYIDGRQRNQWSITTAGISYAQTLATQTRTQSQWQKLTSNAVTRALSEIGSISSTSEALNVNTTIMTGNRYPHFVSNISVNESSEVHTPEGTDAIDQLVIAKEQMYSSNQIFEPNNIQDAREHKVEAIVRRRGQPTFRRQLLTLYQGRCAITGTNVEQVLEAAHIIPYKGKHTNHPTNGLLLRADLHTLFDLRLIAVDSKTMTVLVSPILANTNYNCFAGKCLKLPINKVDWPSAIALDIHRNESNL